MTRAKQMSRQGPENMESREIRSGPQGRSGFLMRAELPIARGALSVYTPRSPGRLRLQGSEMGA